MLLKSSADCFALKILLCNGLLLHNDLSAVIMIFYFWAGKCADIRYGTGAISGFFSEDHVKIGGVVAEDQVCTSALIL